MLLKLDEYITENVDKVYYTFDELKELEGISSKHLKIARLIDTTVTQKLKDIKHDIKLVLGQNVSTITQTFYQHDNFTNYSYFVKFRLSKRLTKQEELDLMNHIADNSLSSISYDYYFEVKRWFGDYIIDFEYII